MVPSVPTEIQAYVPDAAIDTSDQPGRSGAELALDASFRRAMGDLQRLGIVADVREVRPGLLSVLVGPEYGMSSTDYNLNRLLAAYRGTVDWDQTAEMELWQDYRKLGRYTGTGFRPVSPLSP